jgi:hypothetical protein
VKTKTAQFLLCRLLLVLVAITMLLAILFRLPCTWRNGNSRNRSDESFVSFRLPCTPTTYCKSPTGEASQIEEGLWHEDINIVNIWLYLLFLNFCIGVAVPTRVTLIADYSRDSKTPWNETVPSLENFFFSITQNVFASFCVK